MFWPTIRNDGDFDYITRQGFWICLAVAAVSMVVAAFTGSVVDALEGLFFLLAGIGVRERSRVAAIVAFSADFLSASVLQRDTGHGFGIVQIVCSALLFANILGNWLSARWEKDVDHIIVPLRLNQTITDKFTDQLPTILWPKVRHVFYVLAGAEITLLLFLLVGPRT